MPLRELYAPAGFGRGRLSEEKTRRQWPLDELESESFAEGRPWVSVSDFRMCLWLVLILL